MPGQAQEGRDDVIRREDAELEIATVLRYEQITGPAPGYVVDAGQRRTGQVVVVGDGEPLMNRVVAPHPVVPLGREPAEAVGVRAALAAAEDLGAGHLVARSRAASAGVGNARPRDRTLVDRPDENLQRPGGQGRPGGGP